MCGVFAVARAEVGEGLPMNLRWWLCLVAWIAPFVLAAWPGTVLVAAKTHVVTVNSDGSFTPAALTIYGGDTVEWVLHEPTDAVLPVDGTQPFPAVGSAFKPYVATDPNEFTGPMPRAAGGIFSRGQDGTGLVELNAPLDPTDPIAPCGYDSDGERLPYVEGVRIGDKILCRIGDSYDILDEMWTSPSISGLLLHMRWSDLQPAEGPPDFSDLDRQMDDAVQHGKLVSLVFKAGKHGTPDWIFSTDEDGTSRTTGGDVQRLLFQDGGSNNEKCGSTMYLGSPARQAYKDRYFGFLEAVAEHLKSKNAWYRAVAYMKPSGANLFSPENRLPKRAHCDPDASCVVNNNAEVWATQGDYTPEAMLKFYEEQFDLLKASFPNKDFAYMLIQEGFPRIVDEYNYEICDPDNPGKTKTSGSPLPRGTAMTTEILELGVERLGERFIMQHNAIGRMPQEQESGLCPEKLASYLSEQGLRLHVDPRRVSEDRGRVQLRDLRSG